jgi:phage gpG-like protein
MAAGVSVQVDDSRAIVAIGRFQLSLQQNQELMGEIGASQLLSIRRTFREGGSPAGSWVPLAPSTIRRNPRKYGAGHKLLIDKGDLLNSIGWRATPGSVTIGTSLKYAAVHQFGSRDRGGVAIGPITREGSQATANVKAHSYTQTYHDRAGDRSGEVERYTSTGFKIKGRRRALVSGVGFRRVNVRQHDRHQNIPPRPYLVFRPEDPTRIRGIVVRYINRASVQAGLGGGQ